jgi:hypothetical protein
MENNKHMTSLLSKLKEAKDNHRFLALIEQDFTFLMQLISFMKDQPEASL